LHINILPEIRAKEIQRQILKSHGKLNLVLAGPESGANAPKNQWAAVAAAHQSIGEKSESFILARLYDFGGIAPKTLKNFLILKWARAEFSFQSRINFCGFWALLGQRGGKIFLFLR